jgi:hypothetical protein
MRGHVVMHLTLDSTHMVAQTALLPVVLVFAGVGSALIVALALVALARRRSPSYLLVALALATLAARTVVAALTMRGALPTAEHHLLEHGLDVAMAGLVIAAVYCARTVEPRRPEGADGEESR